MRSHLTAALAAVATAILSLGCSTSSTSMGASPSSGSIPSAVDRQCQVFRGYARDRAITNVMEECARQMGVEACRTCLGVQ